MSKLPQLSGQECVAILHRFGFRIVRQRGSHIVLCLLFC
jgi:predicted RNA binding protein YcfA (HicA-like mRNA interferase family)